MKINANYTISNTKPIWITRYKNRNASPTCFRGNFQASQLTKLHDFRRIIPKELQEKIGAFVRLAQQDGKERTFIHGGFVRDMLFQSKFNDIDLCINVDIRTFIANFLRQYRNKISGCRINKNGCAKIKYDGIKFDLTPFKDANLDIDKTILNKSKGSDFTINSMQLKTVMDSQGKLDFGFLDYLSGEEDLRNGVLKLSNPNTNTLVDNPIQIIRAYRFKHKYKLTFDKQLEKEIKELLFEAKFKKDLKHYNRLKYSLLGLIREVGLAETIRLFTKEDLYKIL